MSRVAFPITTLGPGRRLGLWVQGCTLHCEGCVSTDTWDENGGVPVDATELATLASDLIANESLDGLTITGGEPLQQSDGLVEFLIELRRLRGYEVDVLVFTGFTADVVRTDFGDIASLADAFVCGPYMSSLATDNGLIASSNQEVFPTSRLGEETLASYLSSATRQMQACVMGPEIIFAGIPRVGGMSEIEEKLLERGIKIGDRSWAK